MPSLSRASKAPCMRSRSDSEPTRMPTTVSGMGDVATELHSGEIYARGGLVCGGPRIRDGRAERCDIEDAAPVRHEAPIVERGTGMEDEGACRFRIGDAGDRRRAVGALGVVAACENDRDCGALSRLQGNAGDAPRRACVE